MEKLISMTEFVLEQYEKYENLAKYCESVYNHANFLRQTLNISMFVPAKFIDGVWVVLEEPNPISIGEQIHKNLYEAIYDLKEVEEYESAKSNVLFEGFVLIKEHTEYWLLMKDLFDYKLFKNETIEGLVKFKPTLTTTAKKQIGL